MSQTVQITQRTAQRLARRVGADLSDVAHWIRVVLDSGERAWLGVMTTTNLGRLKKPRQVWVVRIPDDDSESALPVGPPVLDVRLYDVARELEWRAQQLSKRASRSRGGRVQQRSAWLEALDAWDVVADAFEAAGAERERRNAMQLAEILATTLAGTGHPRPRFWQPPSTSW